MRGGPQLIPRPPEHRPGAPAPWSHLRPDERRITVEALRTTFTGRTGAPSTVEGHEAIRPSAVVACLWEDDGDVEVLLTRRSHGVRSHKGEVSFPGGRSEPGESPVDAALREAFEEVGLDPASVDVLGELDHLMTVSSNSFIVPFVGLLAERPTDLVVNVDEVDAVLFASLDELLLDEVYREERWAWPGDVTADRPIFFFELVGDTVWGATGAMLRQLLGLALGLPLAIDHR